MRAFRFEVNERPSQQQLHRLWSEVWGVASRTNWDSVLSRSLCFVCCYKEDQLIGFVNVAWDGGVHASVFDTSVHPDFRLQGVGMSLVQRAVEEAASRGAEWLHVDFEPHLAHFYRSCGFRPAEAGLIRLSQ